MSTTLTPKLTSGQLVAISATGGWWKVNAGGQVEATDQQMGSPETKFEVELLNDTGTKIAIKSVATQRYLNLDLSRPQPYPVVADRDEQINWDVHYATSGGGSPRVKINGIGDHWIKADGDQIVGVGNNPDDGAFFDLWTHIVPSS